MPPDQTAVAVFAVSVLTTFAVALVGRSTSKRRSEDDVADRSMNRWLVGLSAGATANSGFVVTAAVGLGYSAGLQWAMLPLAWLLGDLVFWHWFPERINSFGRHSGAITISAMLRHGLRGPWATAVSTISAVVVVAGLGGYTAAQWLAGQVFLIGAFGLSTPVALVAFAFAVTFYSTFGGFRGSVYADTFQALIRLSGTLLVAVSALWFVLVDRSTFAANLADVPTSFFRPFPDASTLGAMAFVVGWATAALGFGLGQPQILSRFLAGRDPMETKAARWIYIGYVQATWITMTLFGVLLRGLMPSLSEPETGLSTFVQTHLAPVATGIIVADIFGAIASTANSLLIAMSQSIRHDLLEPVSESLSRRLPLAAITPVVGIGTLALSAGIGGTVASVALASVSLVGAGLAFPVMAKIMGWTHTGVSLTIAVCTGMVSAVAWAQVGLGTFLNEAAVGLACGAFANYLTLLASYRPARHPCA